MPWAAAPPARLAAARAGARATQIGRVGGDRLVISIDGDVAIDALVEALSDRYENAIPEAMGVVAMSE